MGFTKPLSLGLTPLVEAYELTTFVLDPCKDSNIEYDFESPADIKRFYQDNGVFGVGKFNARNLVAFEKHFGRSLDKAIATWFAVDCYETIQSDDRFGEYLGSYADGVSFDPDTNVYTTTTGKLAVSPQVFALQILAFVFSQYGQVVDVDKNGEYVLEPCSYEVMLDIIDPIIAFSQVGDSESSLFQTVIKLIRGFGMDEIQVEEPEVEEGASKPKNSRQGRGKGKSTTNA